MNTATNLIRVVRALVEQMTPVISIDSTTDNGDGTYTLETCGTYWVTEQLQIEIDGVSYTVQSFTKDTEIIVSGPSLPAVNFFQLDAPRFRPGTHRKVSEEMEKKDKTVVPFVYLPISTITEQTEYDAELAYIADINPFFVVPYDFKKDETDQHQTLFIEPAGSMADYFLNLVLDQEDKFNRPDQTNRKEWQNFGESTRWGFTEDIFSANVSAVSLDFELNVQRDWACECETPSGDSCLPVTIYRDGSFETSVASGGRFDYSTAGADAGNILNGTTLTPIVGGTTKAFTIRYEDDSPVTVTTISDSATAFIGEVPNPPTLLNSSSIYKSGASSGNTQLSGDEGETEDGRGVDWDTLEFNNPFGNTNRFTDTLGTQIYSNSIMLDWASYDPVGETVRAYRMTLLGASRLDTALASSPYTFDSYSDWLIVTGQQLDKITNYNQSADWLNYTPLNIGSASYNIWTRTRQGANRYFILGVNGFANTFFSGSAEVMITRQYTLTELGL